jgi:hypothetical protein
MNTDFAARVTHAVVWGSPQPGGRLGQRPISVKSVQSLVSQVLDIAL